MSTPGPSAFRRGFAIARSQGVWWAVLCAQRMLAVFLNLFVWLFTLTWVPRMHSGIALAAALFALSMGAEVLRWLVLGSAVFEAAHPGLLGHGLLAISGRSLTALLWTWMLNAFATLLIGMTLGSSAWAYLKAWDHPGAGAVPAAAVFAGALTGLFPAALFLSIWTELAFVESVRNDQAYLVSLAIAAEKFARCFWSVAAIFFGTAILAWMAQGLIATVANGILTGGRGFFDIPFRGVSQVTGALLLGMAGAFLELARLQAFSVLEAEVPQAASGPAISPLA